jgi:RNA polymerase sigma-70 factor (ECF subfamily)
MTGEVEYASLDDAELIRLSQEGDQAAFGEMVRRHRDRVYGQVYKMLPSPDEALDLSQDVWVKAWTRLYQFQGDSPFTTWITRIAINVCLDYHRKRQRRPAEDSIEELTEKSGEGSWTPVVEVDARQELDRAERRALILEALDQLSEEQRTVLECMYAKQLEYKEIAQEMGCSIGTVMSRLFYGKKALGKKIKSILEKRGMNIEDVL